MIKPKDPEKQHATNKVNLTIKLDKALLREIRILAAEQDTSISSLVAELVREKAEKRDSYEEAKKRALALMDKGIDGVWDRDYTRDELHERR